MSPLVEKLTAQHRDLLATLDKMTEQGIASPAGRNTLFGARDALLAHLALEDREFYPRLRKAAQAKAALQSTLNVFASDLEGITQTAIAFFKRYGDASAAGDSLDFARDLGRLMAALRTRIRKEETLLYPEYDALE